jgi:peptidyl-prolyl cis-trans isomerase A (cyclophilin A)
VLIETSLGDIVAVVYPEQAPITAKNFLSLVDLQLYNGANFYRVTRDDNQPNQTVKIDVIQGGLREGEPVTLTPIAHETTQTTGLHHLNGTLSMARSEPGTASSEFFICIGNQPELDFGGRRNPDGAGFAAFGKVVKGMDVVCTIQKRQDKGQYLIEPVKIISIRRQP